MNINPTEISPNLIQLNFIMEASEIKSKFDTEVKKTAKKAHVKGFRPGKAPVNLVKKMDGTKILVNTINDSLGKGFTSYLKDNNISAYGEPVFIKDGNNFAYDYNNLTDYDATFAIVKELDFDTTNWDFIDGLKAYSLILTEEEKATELDFALTKLSVSKDFDGPIDDTTIVTFDAAELENGDLKTDGYSMTFSFPIADITNQEIKDVLIGKNIVETLEINLKVLQDKEYLFLNDILQLPIEDTRTMDDFSDLFKVTIKSLEKLEKAEPNEDFFSRLDPSGKINTVERFYDHIERDFDNSANHIKSTIFILNLRKEALENIQLELSDEFYNKYYKQHNNYTEAFIEKNYDRLKEDFKWFWIMNTIQLEYGIEVTQNDVYNKLRSDLSRHFGFDVPQEMLDIYHKNLADSKKLDDIYNEIFTLKIEQSFINLYNLERVKVNGDEFNEIQKNLASVIPPLEYPKHNHDHDHDHDHDHNHDHDHDHNHDHDHGHQH